MRHFAGIHFLLVCSPLLLLRPLTAPAQQVETALLSKACGPDSAKFEVRRENIEPSSLDENASKSRVTIFVESFGNLGGCGPVRIGVDGKWIGAACLGTWFTTDLNPGTHHLCIDFHWGLSGRRAALRRLTVEAGKTYYIRAEVVDSFNLNAAVHLYPLDEDEGELLVNTHKLSRSKPK